MNEALLDYVSTGILKPVEIVQRTADPFAHPDALRRVRTIESEDALRLALNYPWERWSVLLHPSQAAVVERVFNGPARVTGSAGTGKTVVALHRAARALIGDATAPVGGIVYVNGDSRPKFSLTTAHTLKAASGNGGRACVAYRDENGVAQIRELLPVEWERLQGFPDGWTDIEWRGRRAPKTLRQKALGNSFAVPDVRSIGKRIKAAMDGTLELHHWPEPSLGGGPRWEPKEDDFGLGDVKFKYLPKEKWAWAA